jgi:hypothetical protein
MRGVLRTLMGLWLCGLLLGCGQDLTDGSIPVGDIEGWVVAPGRGRPEPVAEWPVEVWVGDTLVRTVRTDAAGHFTLSPGPTGRVRLRTTYAAWTAVVEAERLLATEPLTVRLEVGPTPREGTALLITPATFVLLPGSEAHFTAAVADAAGNTLTEAAVSWAVVGEAGELTAAGGFRARQAGTALLIAQCGTLQSHAPVTVLPGARGRTP